MSPGIIIAIDGPAASGKSTTARLVARELHYLYVDTGAMYRAAAWLFREHGLIAGQASDSEISELLNRHPVRLTLKDGFPLVFAGSADVTAAIRTPEVTRLVSAVSALKPVRRKMVGLQQEMGNDRRLVMDGRDIGTVVFPDAELKIFMVADAESRARRRMAELTEKGQTVRFEELLEEIRQRDEADSSRDEAPLKPASDAILIDTSNLSIDEQVQLVVNKARHILQGLTGNRA